MSLLTTSSQLREVKRHFKHHNVILPDTFNISSFAKHFGLKDDECIVLLCHLECDITMQEIADGETYSFDPYDEVMFDDHYNSIRELLQLD